MSAKKKPEPAKVGRPSKWSDEIAAEICERLSKGEPLAVICRDEHMPAVRTVSDWTKADARFSADFLRAREEGGHALAAQCLDISDDERHDWKMTRKGTITNEVAIARAKLQVETRLKLLAKWFPKAYGDKLDVNHGGEVKVKVTIGGDV